MTNDIDGSTQDCSNSIANALELLQSCTGPSILGWVSRDEYQVYSSTCIPARLDTLVYWEPFSWLTSVGTTRNTVIRLGWSRIGLAVLILHAAGVGLADRPAVISGRYDKYHSLQLQNYYAHFPPLQHTRTFMQTQLCGTVHGNDHGFRGILCWPWQGCDRVKRPIGH